MSRPERLAARGPNGVGPIRAHRGGVLVATLALLLFRASAAEAAGPFFRTLSDGAVELSALPQVLARPEVRPHLDSGLTTTFLLTVELIRPGLPSTRGAARVDIRWEPWDEVFHVTAVGADGQPRRYVLPSFEALAGWWSALVLPVTPRGNPPSSQAKVELQVLPFSSAEQEDAQRWFSGALGPEAAGDPPSAETGTSRLDGVVDLLMATSIQRRVLARYQWRATPAASAVRR
jgi:hypothetical protein